jgi:hypothetical protein
MTSFTTSAETDEVAPAAPRDIYASIVTTREGDIEAISVAGRLPDDAALVRVDIRDASGAITRLITTPRRMFMCQPQLRITPGKATVEIRAVDLAGNQSEPVATEVTTATAVGRDPDLDCEHGAAMAGEHHRHGHGYEILLFVVVAPCFFIAWLVIVVMRRAFVKRHLAEPITLLEAEAIARRLSRWQVLWSAMLIGLAIAMQSARDINDLAIFLAPFIFSSLGQLFFQRRALHLLDRPNVDAVRRGPWLVVTTLQDSVTVRASDIDFVVAKRSSIPSSIAH